MAYWRMTCLPESFRQELERVGLRGGVEASPFYFRSRYRPGWLAFSAGLGTLASAGLLFVILAIASDPHSEDTTEVVILAVAGGLLPLAFLWTVLGYVELARGLSSRLKPFFLLTPRILMQVDYDFGVMEGYALKDVVDFQTTNIYHGGQFKGREYVFVFPQNDFRLFVKRPQLEQVESVLSQARGGGSKEYRPQAIDVLPADGTLKPAFWRAITNPYGSFWVTVGGVGLCVLVVLMILAHGR